MKKLTTLFSAALCTVALCGAENLVKNGDFSGETLAPWTSPQRMKKVIHSLKDGKLVVTGDSQNKYNRELNCIQNLPALEIGKAYLLSGTAISKAAPKQGKSCRVNIRAINSKGGSIGYYGFVIDLSKKDIVVVTGILELYSALVKENDGFTKSLPDILAKLNSASK